MALFFWRILLYMQQTLSSCELEWLTSTLCFFSPFMPTGKKQHANWCPQPHSWQPLSKDTWFLLSNHTNNASADLNASIKTGRREHLLNVNYVPGLGMLMPCLSTSSHCISSHLSSHPLIWMEEEIQNGESVVLMKPMAVITWEASLSAYPLIQQFHF